MLSKLILTILLLVFIGKLGLRAKLRHLRPRFERAVNITLVVLGVAYVGQLAWLLIYGRGR